MNDGVGARRRLGRNDYFKVGMQRLAEGGIGTATIANVCARLHVTKGSFYHHFESGSAFHTELLAHYEEEYAHRRIAAVDTIADAADRLDALLERGVERDHEAESAIRAWSRTDPIAAEVVHRVDADAGALSRGVLRQPGHSRSRHVSMPTSPSPSSPARSDELITDRRKVQAMLSEHRAWVADAIEKARVAKASAHARRSAKSG